MRATRSANSDIQNPGAGCGGAGATEGRGPGKAKDGEADTTDGEAKTGDPAGAEIPVKDGTMSPPAAEPSTEPRKLKPKSKEEAEVEEG